jgi:ferritin
MKKKKKKRTPYHISEKFKKLLIKQYKQELKNHLLYMLIASKFHKDGKMGFYHFFRLQGIEEFGHAMKLFNYLIERNVEINDYKHNEATIKEMNLKSEEDIVKTSLIQEIHNTEQIKQILDESEKEKDYHLRDFLSWFIKEQLEEEMLFAKILKKFDMLKDSNQQIYEIDKDLGKRKAKEIVLK